MTNPGVCQPCLGPTWTSYPGRIRKRFRILQLGNVTGNYNFETGSMISILEQLGWESLHKRRKDSKLILVFKGLKGRASIPWDDLQIPNRRSR